MKTRIAGLHFSDARPVDGEVVTIAGYLQWYDEKELRWYPAEHKKVKLKINDVVVDETSTTSNGYFKFKYAFPPGTHEIEVCFDGSAKLKPVSARKTIKTMSAGYKRRMKRLIKTVIFLFFLLFLTMFMLAMILSKMGTGK